MNKKSWIALGAAAAAAMTLAVPAAHAGNASIYLNIDAGVPSYYGHGYPNYTYSQPAYVYTQPAYVYGQPGYGYSRPYYGGGHRHQQRRDRDGDGIPNRYDRDLDGDGVPNRYDRRPGNPYRY